MKGLRDTFALARVSLGLGWRWARGLLLVTLLLATAGALASVAYTLGFRVIIDGALHHDGGELVRGTLLVAVLFTVAWAFGTLGASTGGILTDRITLELGARIGALTAALPTLAPFERSDQLARLDMLRTNRRALGGATRQLLGSWQVGLRALGIVVLLATVYPPILLVPAFAVAPALAARRAGRVQRDADDALAERRRLRDDLFALLMDSGAARELRTYGIGGTLAARHAALAEEVRRDELRATVRGAAWEALGWSLFAAGFVAAIVVLVLRATTGHVSPGGVVMAVSLMRRAQRQVDRGTDVATSLGTALRTAGQLRWLEEASATTTASGRPPARLAEGIALDGVTFTYPGAERPVLQDVQLDLPAGAVVALVGENGAGKSTLVKLLLGLYEPDAGTIRVDGAPLTTLDPLAWRERTSAVFQDFLRPSLLAREAVGLGDPPRVADDAAVGAALTRANATGVVATLDTQLGRAFGGAQLSGGQWQRLALARGQMRDTPLLLVLDEPTASVDVPTERALFERLADSARAGARDGRVTILVTHRFTTARAADLIVVLEHGRVVEHGSHEQLLAAGGTYAELLELQARAYRDAPRRT